MPTAIDRENTAENLRLASPIDYGHCPRWLWRRLRVFLRGRGISVGMIDSHWLLDIYRQRIEPTHTWLDHWGTFIDPARRLPVLVSEPYGRINDEPIKRAIRFAANLNLTLTASKESVWNPPRTMRLEFYPDDHT